MAKYYLINKDFNLKKLSKVEKKTFSYKNPLEKYSNIGYYLLVPVIIFLIIGIYFDKFFETKPVGFIFFLFFGVLSCFYNLYRLIKE